MSFCVVPPHGVTDINECLEIGNICGPNADCSNSIGKYTCTCLSGYTKQDATSHTCIGETLCVCCFFFFLSNEAVSQPYPVKWFFLHCVSTPFLPDIDECVDGAKPNEGVCGINGTCINSIGGFWCECPTGFTNYGNERTPCSGNGLKPFCTE